jgi:hypothetical protein
MGVNDTHAWNVEQVKVQTQEKELMRCQRVRNDAEDSALMPRSVSLCLFVVTMEFQSSSSLISHNGGVSLNVLDERTRPLMGHSVECRARHVDEFCHRSRFDMPLSPSLKGKIQLTFLFEIVQNLHIFNCTQFNLGFCETARQTARGGWRNSIRP